MTMPSSWPAPYSSSAHLEVPNFRVEPRAAVLCRLQLALGGLAPRLCTGGNHAKLFEMRAKHTVR